MVRFRGPSGRGRGGGDSGDFGGIAVSARFGAFTLDSDQRQLTSETSGELHLTPKASICSRCSSRKRRASCEKASCTSGCGRGRRLRRQLVGLVKEIGARSTIAIRTPRSFEPRTVSGYAFAGELRPLPLAGRT